MTTVDTHSRYVRLGDLLSKSNETTKLNDTDIYHEITVRLHGKGATLRKYVKGSDIAADSRFVARAGQLIFSKIDARHGALAIVPQTLNGAVVSSDFPLYNVDTQLIEIEYLGLLVLSAEFVELCRRASEGSTNRVRLKERVLLNLEILLPSILDQRRIVRNLQQLLQRLDYAKNLMLEVAATFDQLLISTAEDSLMFNAPTKPMGSIAPLVRRPVSVDVERNYPELGVRSFGKGTFHKPPLQGADVGAKKLFWIHPGDLVFQIVFAWEGAVAIAKPEDANRCGSHRFLTCVCNSDQVLADWLLFYFLTPLGLAQLGEASPGGAGRNRTLGIEKLARMQVPVPPLELQAKIANIMEAKRKFLELHTFEKDAEALRRSILAKTFRGEL